MPIRPTRALAGDVSNFCTSTACLDVQRLTHDSCLTMAYELFYAFRTTSTCFEKLAFLAWFELDLSFVIVALQMAHSVGEQRVLVRNMILGCLTGIAFLWMLAQRYPDEREQVTAYWTGIILQLPIGWICLHQLWKDHSTKGHSLEMWYVHCTRPKDHC
jgi:hypothetical protein